MLSTKEDPGKDLKYCEWCGRPFHPTHGNEKYHLINELGIHCKEEARKEKTRLRVQKYSRRFKKKNDIEKLGTFDLPKYNINNISDETYLGTDISNQAWDKEYNCIHKLREKISVSPNSKRENPKRINSQYKGSINDDYFSITMILENPGPCPICGEQFQEKDLTRCELICRNPECEDVGGVVIRGTQYHIDYPETPGNRMAFTTHDISDSETAKQYDKDISVQDVAWNKFWIGH